jgi:iron-sulfur cluster insertion protein
MTEMSLTVTEAACNRVEEIRTKKGNANLKLRITVEGGGCSGFQYNLSEDAAINDDDHVFADAIVIDEASLEILNGSKVDFVSSLMGEEFKIANPNAVASCGCGTSFAI